MYQFDIEKHSPNNDLTINRIELNSMVPSEEQLSSELIGLGDEVVIIGAFVGRVGKKKNIPVVRIGNVAAMAEEPTDFGSQRRPAYLLETRSLGGISGSPVFVNLTNIVKFGEAPGVVGLVRRDRVAADGTRSQSSNYNLLGMVIGAHGSNYFSDFVAEFDSDIKSSDFEFNAGISVAIPSSVIVEFLAEEHVRTARQRAIEARRKISGYKPTSARDPSGAVASAAESNPRHREDFTSLLNAAAKTKPQAD